MSKLKLKRCPCCYPMSAVDPLNVVDAASCSACGETRLLSPCASGRHRLCFPCLEVQPPVEAHPAPSRS